MAAHRRAIDHVEFLVKIERAGFPLTLNHYFASTISARRKARMEKQLRDLKSWQTND